MLRPATGPWRGASGSPRSLAQQFVLVPRRYRRDQEECWAQCRWATFPLRRASSPRFPPSPKPSPDTEPAEDTRPARFVASWTSARGGYRQEILTGQRLAAQRGCARQCVRGHIFDLRHELCRLCSCVPSISPPFSAEAHPAATILLWQPQQSHTAHDWLPIQASRPVSSSSRDWLCPADRGLQ